MVKHLSTAAALALLSASPSQAYFTGRLCYQAKQSYRSSGSLYVATSSAPEARTPGKEEHGSDNRRMAISTAEARLDGATAEVDNSRRWINDVKSGDKIIGYVKDTTNFAAFVDVGVVRRGAKGKVVPVTGFLHSTDVIPPYALANTKRAKDCEVEVKKGIHLTTFVKDVFPNAGRVTLSLDPSMDKKKVLKMRGMRRERSHSQRRERRAEKGRVPEVGEVTEGYVRQVQDSLLLVDVMRPQLSVLRAANILRVTGEEGLNLGQKVKPGDRITVRIEKIVDGKARRGADEKALVEFVGWGAAKSS